MKSHTVFFDHAFLPDGWRKNVRITVSGNRIASVETDANPAAGERVAGIALPGIPNVPCHSFQRAMAGLAERRGPANESFWTGREIMYRFLDRLTPDDVEAITAFAYMEMLERGFTAVGEFHYLHHAPDGSPYADIGEMAARIAGHVADIVKGVPGAVERDRRISIARPNLDWEGVIRESLDPELVKRRLQITQDREACSMCGKLCAVKISRMG